jgi:peptide/nickel transport system permease protein
MREFVVRRVAFALFLVFAVSSAAVVLTHLAPGDFATSQFGPGVRAEALQQARSRYGLDKPVGVQYRDWLVQAVRLDFGRSLVYDRPVAELVPERAANTLLLAASALLLATVLGLPLGVVAATRGGVVSQLIRAVSLLLLSTPPLLTSLFLVLAAAQTGWLPVGGMRSVSPGSASPAADVLLHMVVPVTALGLPLAAMLERLQARTLAEVLEQPFILAALARGASRTRVIWRDGLRVALGPVVAMYGLLAASLLSGSFVVEMITAWPGLGRLVLDALMARDVYLVAGGATAGAVFLALGTLCSDLAVAVADPRTRDLR